MRQWRLMSLAEAGANGRGSGGDIPLIIAAKRSKMLA
jgi:hypothetical protein